MNKENRRPVNLHELMRIQREAQDIRSIHSYNNLIKSIDLQLNDERSTEEMYEYFQTEIRPLLTHYRATIRSIPPLVPFEQSQ